MLKRIFGPKSMSVLSFGILLIFCLCVVFLVSSLLGEKTSPQVQGRYEIGQHVVDSGGSVWRYKGNFRAELGQLTPDLKLLSVIVCSKEYRVDCIHKELIPDTVIGDLFKLFKPSPELMTQLSGDFTTLLEPPAEGYCNLSVGDPPAFMPGAGIGICCLRYFCDD